MASQKACLTTMAIILMITSPAPSDSSLTCTSQKLTNNKLYDHCSDLSSLNSYLHWTYDSSNSSLSIAFVAKPSNSNGWIAWAINPSGTGMIGAQSLIAFKQSDGSMTVKTFNLSSYISIFESKLSFDVWEISAEESSDGVMMMFAKVAMPGNLTVVNQVWQVGSEVKDNVPVKHEMESANMNAKGTVDLLVEKKSGGDDAGGNVGFVCFLVLVVNVVVFKF